MSEEQPAASVPARPPPLPAFIERSLRAQQMLPSHRPVREFFARALADFQASGRGFQVLCTAGHASREMPRGADALPPPPRPSPSPGAGRRLVVLDSSFNPPTQAHMRMAVDALRGGGGSSKRLVLLLSVNNADKKPKPAGFEQRMAMMWAFARDMHGELSGAGTGAERAGGGEQEGRDDGGMPIDIALTTKAYFHDKSSAIAEDGFYGADGPEQEQEQEQEFLTGYDTLIRIFNPKYYSSPASPNYQPSAGEETPMKRALSPFFGRARLRVVMRADDEWGGREEQVRYVEGLKGPDGLLRKVGGREEWADKIDLVEGRREGEEIVSSTLARAAAKAKDWAALGKLVSPEVGRWIEREGLYEEEEG
ncbi:uncharacterized protein E0L32_007659 [Thyridium curvatum]|uniref:Cytidyltransferase-like domain-containing protein n=1 Tax=Thyridium curvatum TaxID=1093900 RepID=A0A507B513_9PEZI|nr:uncharacterized protein E0L32_007659 [Thyridium curvatum]TPX11680.1 hypothetical protein E0L32_007659 [Thyridium curvatum]